MTRGSSHPRAASSDAQRSSARHYVEPMRVRRAKRHIGAGMTLALLGIASGVSTRDEFVPYLTLIGVLLTLWGLHRLGRSGSAPIARP